MTRTSASALLLLAGLAAAGCSDDGHDHDHGNEAEVITTVALTFTATGGGAAITAEVDDPDGDGGDPPAIDPIELNPGAYTLTVRFENRLEDPAEDITAEIEDEADEHQLFFTGTAVTGPASAQAGAPLTHAYRDQDGNGLPIGLENTVDAIAGAGELTVTLRHLPPVNGAAVKTNALAGAVADGGFAAIGGATDVQVTIPVTVE